MRGDASRAGKPRLQAAHPYPHFLPSLLEIFDPCAMLFGFLSTWRSIVCQQTACDLWAMQHFGGEQVGDVRRSKGSLRWPR
jgi:hypothetical protein